MVTRFRNKKLSSYCTNLSNEHYRLLAADPVNSHEDRFLINMAKHMCKTLLITLTNTCCEQVRGLLSISVNVLSISSINFGVWNKYMNCLSHYNPLQNIQVFFLQASKKNKKNRYNKRKIGLIAEHSSFMNLTNQIKIF